MTSARRPFRNAEILAQQRDDEQAASRFAVHVARQRGHVMKPGTSIEDVQDRHHPSPIHGHLDGARSIAHGVAHEFPEDDFGLVDAFRIGRALAETVGECAAGRLRGLRIRVRDVLDLLAAGASREEILEDYPILEAGDIVAALEYAARQSDHPILRVA